MQYKHWWNNWVPLKVNFLGWRAVLNRLPVKSELKRRQVTLPEYVCGLCRVEEETCSHLFLNCPWAKEVWRGVDEWGNLGLGYIATIDQLLSGAIQQPQTTRILKTKHAVILVTLWAISKTRNDRNFNAIVTPSWRIIEQIKSQTYLWLKNRGASGITDWANWSKFPFTVH
ncbi:hypothetical protein LXL04_006921 [Taraxacum kok-saghyz]